MLETLTLALGYFSLAGTTCVFLWLVLYQPSDEEFAPLHTDRDDFHNILRDDKTECLLLGLIWPLVLATLLFILLVNTILYAFCLLLIVLDHLREWWRGKKQKSSH